MTDLMTDIGLVTIRVYGYRLIELSGQLKAQLFWHFRGSPRTKTRKWDWAVSGGLSRTLPVSFIGDKKIMIINVFLVVMRKL